MQTVKNLSQIAVTISTLSPGDWLVVDVDNTLIMPEDAIFQGNSPDKDFIDRLKKQNSFDLATNLSKWRLKRKVKLVENNWPEVLKTAKAKGVLVLALTLMDTGAYGIIPSMEKWRFDELKNMDLIFSNYAAQKVEVLIPSDRPATIYQGIMFTNTHSKAEVLAAFTTKYSTKPKRLVFVDDRMEQVTSIEDWCNANQIDVIACHYTASEHTQGTINLERNALQIASFTKGDWLSDTEI